MGDIEGNKLSGVDAVYYEIGRFIVAFSHLQSTTELMIVYWLAPGGKSNAHQRIWAVMSGQTMQFVADSFFSLCNQIKGSEWSKDDLFVIRCTRKEINSLISERNRIVNDVWSLGNTNRPLPANSDAERVRFGRSPNRGATMEGYPVTVSDLDTLTTTADRLRDVVNRIGAIGISGTVGKPSEQLEVFERGKVRVKR
jgi:hypothetical protein